MVNLYRFLHLLLFNGLTAWVLTRKTRYRWKSELTTEPELVRRHRLVPEVDHLCPMHLRHADDLGSGPLGCPHLDQGEFVLDDRVVGHILHLEYVDQLVELLRRLLDRDIVAGLADLNQKEA